MNVDLDKLDLNLLRILQVLVKTKNAQKAAEQLNISSTSVSRALNKLREEFGENLFIRQPHGIEPSEFAYELALASEAMLVPLEQVIFHRTRFNHKQYKGKITIAVNTFLLEIFGTDISQALMAKFPCASFQLECWDNQTNVKMARGDINFGLHFSTYPFASQCYTAKLRRIENRIMCHKTHPLAVLEAGSDWHNLAQYPLVQLLVMGMNEHADITSIEYLKRGITPSIKLKTDNLKTACDQLVRSQAIMVGSDLIQRLYPELSSLPLPTIRDELLYLDISSVFLRTHRDSQLIQHINDTISVVLAQ